MASGIIWTPEERTRQPAGYLGGPSLKFRPKILATPSLQFEATRHKPREISGGYTIGHGVGGVAAICPTTQIPGFVAYTVDAPVSITGDYSLLVYASASGNSSGLETHTIDHGGALALTAFQFSNTSIVGFLDGNTTGSISGVFTQPTVAIAVRRGNTAWLYVGNQSSSSVTGTRAGEPTGLVIGRDRVSNDPAGGVKTYLYALFDYGLSTTDIASLIKNPWQLFEADNDPVFYSLGGGGAAALEGSLAASATVAGALTTAIQAAASVSASASVTAALSTGIPLAASLSGAATVSAAITTAIQMAGSLSATASVSGDISGAAALASSVSTSAIVTGDLTTAIRLNASVSGAATVTGVLAEPGAAAVLEASIAASATVSASLTGGSSTIWTPASASSGTWVAQ